MSDSLGSTTTTCSHPASTSHRYVSPAERKRQGITDGLIRLSVGVEEVAATRNMRHALARIVDDDGEVIARRYVLAQDHRVAPEWRTRTVESIARGMYDARDFSRLPLLADALQDAGCGNEYVLEHCRNRDRVHVRGCWVVDLVLGKS